MREIKFRAWDKVFKIWVNPDIVDLWAIGPLRYESIVHEINQFTGLKDKNGKEIWEGDIVKSPFETGDEFYGPIEYSEKWGTFYLGITNKHGVRIAMVSVNEWLYSEDGEIVAEVIGNIYENPELLETR